MPLEMTGERVPLWQGSGKRYVELISMNSRGLCKFVADKEDLRKVSVNRWLLNQKRLQTLHVLLLRGSDGWSHVSQ